MTQEEIQGYQQLHLAAETAQEWVELVTNPWLVGRKSKRKRTFNRERVERAEQRAMERWRMGVRDPNLEHPERVLQRDAQRRAVEQTTALRAKARENAGKRAESLLLSTLTPAQRETYERHKWFVVEGGKSKTKYRIRYSDHMVANVDVLADDGKVVHRLCCHLDIGTVPTGDQLLAQKLMLEGNEDHFLKTANRHRA